MDLCLALLPWTVIWNLQMKLKEKIGVAVAMSCGVLCVSKETPCIHAIHLLTTISCSAAITAIVKTTKIPAMQSPNPGKPELPTTLPTHFPNTPLLTSTSFLQAPPSTSTSGATPSPA